MKHNLAYGNNTIITENTSNKQGKARISMVLMK
jgi:hypothetical protein